MSAEFDEEDDDMPSPHMEEEHHGDAHDEPWLVSYADMMTLLFGFFVLLYSFEAAKNEGDNNSVNVRKELAQFFGGSYVNPLEGTEGKFQQAIESSDEISPELKEAFKDLSFKFTPEGIEVTFSSTALFKPGFATLDPGPASILNEFIGIISDNKEQYHVTVEGYTDPTPIGSGRFPSNWELSAARATTVIRKFESAGFNPDRLKAIGFGATRPLVPNYDENGEYIRENLSKNRRVVIFVKHVLDATEEELR